VIGPDTNVLARYVVAEQVLQMFAHLLAQPLCTLEDRPAVEQALRCRGCQAVASFDDREFARHVFVPPAP
jgi:hypothetical protein